MIYAPYQKFIEARLTIIDKTGTQVPFTLNPIQSKFVEQASGRDIILKARQQGFSSFILAAFTADFLFKENSLSVVVADIADNALDLLARVKHYIKSYEEQTGVKVPLKYNSKYELHNAANNARYIIGTAERQEFGRSKTITNLHFSEAAFYNHLDKMLAGAESAVVPAGKVVIETTANGFNQFKAFYDRTTLGETPYKAHFFRAEDFYDEEFLNQKRQSLGRLYDQEYPSSAEIAFVTSGETYFDTDAMRYYLENAKEPMKV
jgi:hypothetical protein